jgi:outer membrane protein
VSWAVLLLMLPGANGPMTLERAIEMALEQNERAKIADRQSEQAEARTSRAISFFIPSLTAVGSYVRRPFETVRTFGDGNSVVVQRKDSLRAVGSLDLTVLDARGFPLYRAAKLEEEASKARSIDSKRRLSFEVASAYLNALTVEEVMRAAEQRRESAATNLHDAKARYQAQLVRGSDVTRAEVEVANAEIAVVRAKGDREAAYLSLGFLVGAPVQGTLAEPSELMMTARTSTPSEPGLIDQAKVARLDILAAHRTAESLDALAEEPLWRLVPALTLHGEIFASNEEGFTGRNVDGFGGLTLTWNVFDGGERYAERTERQATAAIASLQASELERLTASDIQRALTALRTARTAVVEAERGAVQAREHAQQIAALYRQGLATALEASDANVVRFQSEIALVQERYRLALALLDLRLSLGVDPLGREVS